MLCRASFFSLVSFACSEGKRVPHHTNNPHHRFTPHLSAFLRCRNRLKNRPNQTVHARATGRSERWEVHGNRLSEPIIPERADAAAAAMARLQSMSAYPKPRADLPRWTTVFGGTLSIVKRPSASFISNGDSALFARPCRTVSICLQ